MKKYVKAAAFLALACALAMPMAGCNKKGVESLTSEELEAVIRSDLQISVVGSEEVTVTETIPAETTTANSSSESVTTTTVTTVTDADGNKYVAATDAQGSTVTDNAGAVVTEPYVEQPTVPTTTTTTTIAPSQPSVSLMETRQALWWDISKKDDFHFNGSFLKFTFKIKEDTADGNYPINIVKTDFSNSDAKSLDVSGISGYVSVGSAEAPQSEPVGSGFTVSTVNVSANAGDTVDVVFRVDNNPGLCGFDFQFQYDTNALEFVSGSFGEDFAAVK